MKCPVCKSPDLVMSERQGIEIDYCPQCRGVWLDRGELDKIIERSAAEAPVPAAYREPPRHEGQGHQGHHSRPDHHSHKRKGFLSDLFDFD